MSLQKLIYASRVAEPPTRADLIAILASARANNLRNQVSGLLVYCDWSFLQILEGEAEVVRATYQRISADDRHTDLRLILDRPTATRRFSSWAMGFQDLDRDVVRRRVPGLIAVSDAPLVSPAVVTDPTVAETLLFHYAHAAR